MSSLRLPIAAGLFNRLEQHLLIRGLQQEGDRAVCKRLTASLGVFEGREKN